MTSLINTSAIDVTKPVTGSPTTQSIRDNTVAIKSGLDTAKSEISALQAETSNINNTSDVNKPVSMAQAAADASTLNTAKSYTDTSVGAVETQVVALQSATSNINNTSDANKPVSIAQATADLTAENNAKNYADSLVVGLLDDRGSYNASTNLFPSTGGSGVAGAIKKGDLWFISTTGTLGGVFCQIGTSIRALVDSPAQTTANWSVIQTTLGFTPENTVNKSTNVDTDKTSDTKYASVKAIYDWAMGLFQTLSDKDTSGGYVGLTLFKINFKNVANTFTSFLTNTNTASRTYIYQDRDYTVAGLDDINALIVNKNLLINPNFIINEQVVSGTVTLAAGAYGHDRWKAGASGCTYTFAGGVASVTLTITAGSLQQVIEGANLPLGSNVCTLSWAGTAQGKINAGSYSASGVTATVTSGTNATVEFNTGTVSLVQFEKGSTATSFERRKVSDELALCQYYCEIITNQTGAEVIANGVITATTTAVCMLTYGRKRVVPTVTITNNWQTVSDTTVTPTAITIGQINIDRCKVNITATYTAGQVGNGCYLQADGTTGRVIKISAEL